MDGYVLCTYDSSVVVIGTSNCKCVASGFLGYKLLMTTREAAWYIISRASVCQSVCQTQTFESLDVGSAFSLIRYISREYWSRSYMRAIGSRSQEQKRSKVLIPAMYNMHRQSLRFCKTQSRVGLWSISSSCENRQQVVIS